MNISFTLCMQQMFLNKIWYPRLCINKLVLMNNRLKQSVRTRRFLVLFPGGLITEKSLSYNSKILAKWPG